MVKSCQLFLQKKSITDVRLIFKKAANNNNEKIRINKRQQTNLPNTAYLSNKI